MSIRKATRGLIWSFVGAANICSGMSNVERGSYEFNKALRRGEASSTAYLDALAMPVYGPATEYMIGRQALGQSYPYTTDSEIIDSIAGAPGTDNTRKIAAFMVGIAGHVAGMPGDLIGAGIGTYKAGQRRSNS